jgi:hypothetical protein
VNEKKENIVVTAVNETIMDTMLLTIRMVNFLSPLKPFAWTIYFFFLLSVFIVGGGRFGFQSLNVYMLFLIMWYVIRMSYTLNSILSELKKKQGGV